MIYSIKVYNDMGHLMTFSEQSFPTHILNFVYSKLKMYISVYTNTTGIGCKFYVLNEGFEKNWKYYCDNDVVNITYELNDFDLKKNETLSPNKLF